MQQPKIVVIGGGSGSFTLLSAFKNNNHQLTALVNMADDGGSTGQLRDELGVLPPGDIRQCLVALSESDDLRDLFNYRFDSGSFKGHAFGNLFLTAVEKMTGNFAESVRVASQILNTVGHVEPVTLTNSRLVIRESNGKTTHGEFRISHVAFENDRPELWLEPNPTANPAALEAIKTADIIVIAPGSLYGSLGPALVVPGIGQALKKSKAAKFYVCNLVTKPGQTDGFTVYDFADEIQRLAGTDFLDYVIYNQKPPTKQLLSKYAAEGELPVKLPKYHPKRNYRIVKANVLANGIWSNAHQSADPIAAQRTLIRHDGQALYDAIVDQWRQSLE